MSVFLVDSEGHRSWLSGQYFSVGAITLFRVQFLEFIDVLEVHCVVSREDDPDDPFSERVELLHGEPFDDIVRRVRHDLERVARVVVFKRRRVVVLDREHGCAGTKVRA